MPALPYKGAFFFLAFTACLFFLANLYGLTPGQAPASAASLSDMGFAGCLRNAGFSLACRNSGYPFGDPSTFGLPVHLVLAVIVASGASPLSAVRLGYGLFLLVAMIGGTWFFKRWAGSLWLALLGVFLFLSSPIVALEGDYGPLRMGFALLPTYVLINLAVIDKFDQRLPLSVPKLLACMLGLTVVHTFALFCDGYSFVMELLVTGLLWASWIIRYLRTAPVASTVGRSLAALSAPIIAVLLYKLYIPASSYTPMPLAFFRGQGVDLFMMIVPSATGWLAAATGWHHAISPYQVYSDGPSSSLVFIGYALLICAVVGAVLVWRSGRSRKDPTTSIVLLAGIFGLALSIGPALKFRDFRAAGTDTISFSSYLMPPGQGGTELGTGWIYEHVPGIKVMRALYRWQLLFRLALVVAALIAIKALASRSPWPALALGLLLVAETVPNVPRVNASGAASARTIQLIDKQPLAELSELIKPGSRVVLAQLHAGANRNEYLASYLCPRAALLCYNVGGDKAAELASDAWPTPIYELISDIRVEANAREAFADGLIDVLLVPLFDLRMQAYAWPPRGFPRDTVIAEAERKFSGFDVTVGDWFVVVRRPAGALDTGKFAFQTYSERAVMPVLDWGPKAVSTHLGTKTYLWVRTDHADKSAVLYIGGQRLPTVQHSETVLAAPIRPSANREILSRAQVLPVYLVRPDLRTRQRIGDIRVNSN